MTKENPLLTVEVLLWWTGLLTTIITVFLGVIFHLAKEKITGFIENSKQVTNQLSQLDSKLNDQDKTFSTFREKVLGDIRLIFSQIDFLKKQTDKVPEIEVKTEKILVTVQAQKERIEDFGKVIRKS